MTGLSVEHIKLLKNWLCFKCINVEVVTDIDLPTRGEVREIVREELAAASKSIQTVIKTDVKSYADVMKSNQKEVLEAARAPSLVKDVCKSLNVEQLERVKKKKNVLVSNVPEPPSNLNGNQRKEHDINYLCDKLKMVHEDIVTCFRAGRVRKDDSGINIARPLVVVFTNEDAAIYWHNDGKGFKIGPHWINEDLCKSDREAKFFVRQQRRNRQQMQEGKPNHQK